MMNRRERADLDRWITRGPPDEDEPDLDDRKNRHATRAAVAVTAIWVGVLFWAAVFGLGRWAGAW